MLTENEKKDAEEILNGLIEYHLHEIERFQRTLPKEVAYTNKLVSQQNIALIQKIKDGL